MKNGITWIGLGFALLFIGGIWFLSAHSFQSDAAEYKKNGITVTGTVQKGESTRVKRVTSYDLYVSYNESNEKRKEINILTDEIPDGYFNMKYVYAECKLMSGKVYNMVNIDEKVDVIFLPENPKENTILALSIMDANITPIHREGIAQVLLAVGGAMMLAGILMRRSA